MATGESKKLVHLNSGVVGQSLVDLELTFGWGEAHVSFSFGGNTEVVLCGGVHIAGRPFSYQLSVSSVHVLD